MNKGFTMVETLAALVILSVIMIFVIPAVQGVSNSVRNQNYRAKAKTIESAMLTFANEYLLDEVKIATATNCATSTDSNTINCCRQYDLYNFVVANGIYSAERNVGGIEQITNPYTHDRMSGCVRIRFNFSTYEAEVQFTENCTWPTGTNTDISNGFANCQNNWCRATDCATNAWCQTNWSGCSGS